MGIGANAILLMGVSSAVRNPGFGCTGGTAVGSLDQPAGPKTGDHGSQTTTEQGRDRARACGCYFGPAWLRMVASRPVVASGVSW